MPRLAEGAIVALALAVAAGGSAQVEPVPSPQPIGGLSFVEEVEVTVVNVDVFVRDRSGRPVEGLGVSDFRVTQDGLEMPISHFVELDSEVIQHLIAPSEVGVPAAPPNTPAAEPQVEVRPVYTVLYVDNENLNPIDRNRILRRVREFVIDDLRQPVQMMVVSYDRSLKTLQPFTDDARAVTEALRSVTTVAGGRPDRDSDRQEILERLQEVSAESGSSGSNANEGARMRLRQQIMSYAEEEANNVNFTLQALREVIDMMSGLEGRKSIIYVSSGLPMTPGLDLMHEYAAVFHDTAILGRRTATDRTQAFQSLTSTANGQDVSFYTIDASGLNPLEGYGAESRYGVTDPGASSIGRRNYQDSLTYMAEYTGGLSIVNTNDIAAGLELIRDDLFSYYSIGYTISATGQDRVHRIEVELPTHSEYQLRYRRRFVEKSRETQVQDRVATSLLVDVDDNPLDLTLTAGSRAPASSDRWTVPLHISFPLSRLALVPEGDEYVGRVVLFLGARDVDGRQSEMQRQEHEVRVPARQYEEAKASRFGIDVQLLLEAGQQRVAVGLMDQLTRQAAYDRIVVTVP